MKKINYIAPSLVLILIISFFFLAKESSSKSENTTQTGERFEVSSSVLSSIRLLERSECVVLKGKAIVPVGEAITIAEKETGFESVGLLFDNYDDIYKYSIIFENQIVRVDAMTGEIMWIESEAAYIEQVSDGLLSFACADGAAHEPYMTDVEAYYKAVGYKPAHKVLITGEEALGIAADTLGENKSLVHLLHEVGDAHYEVDLGEHIITIDAANGSVISVSND